MNINLEGLDWMPSPPLVPASDAIDVAHLKKMTLGERELEREVLAMFLDQSERMIRRLDGQATDGAIAAHTLKGAARAIGAFAVADAAEDVEHALRAGQSAASAIVSLNDAVHAARQEIERLLRHH